MNERYALGHRHEPTAMLGKVILLCVLSLFTSGCALVSSSFPKGFVQIPSKLEAWENPSEGFNLVIVSNNDRAQGFLEWETQGIYGRIVEAGKKGNVWTLSLGDGGMDGVELTAEMQGSSIEVRYSPRDWTGSGGDREEVRIKATWVKAARSLQVLAAAYTTQQEGYTTQEEGRSMSLRLQYLSASQKSLRQVFDEVLRRSKSPYQRAAFVRAQQETISINVHQNSSEKSQHPPLLLEYEEIQYPVFISEHFVSVATQHYLFEGGAHGAASTSFDVIDLTAGRRLDIGDIFEGEGWKTGLSPLLKAELQRQRSFQDAQEKAVLGTGLAGGDADVSGNEQSSTDLRSLGLFEPDIVPSEDVFICGSGIGFEYDRYQIAPWYMGEFIIVLPWSELKPYLSSRMLSAGLFE